MRLVCPECAAQYEVADAAIPEGGRDVQCSACGHGWFQRPSPEQPPMTPVADATPPATPLETSEAPATPPPPRKPLDEKVMAILREEALREAAARRAEPARSTAPEPPPVDLPRPVPEVTLVQPAPFLPPPQPEAAKPAARRGVLPDIEEINSTLATGNRPAPGPLPPADPRPGFRVGFALMTGVVAIAAGAYVLAPRISSAVPETSAAMTAYVAGVDQLRRQLDATVSTAQERVEGLLLSAD
jgi:predicted Zn finger-like uncharacterized protein